MTVENQTNKKRFQGDGVTDTVTFSFRVISSADIKVYVYPRDLDFTDIELYLLSTSNYTVTLDADGEGGEIVFLAGHIPTNTEDALIINSLDLTQTADLPTEGNFNEESVETALDRLVMQNIQQQEKINRGVFISLADPLAEEDFTGLEIAPDTAVSRAGRALIFSAAGDKLETGPTADDIANAQSYAADAETSKNEAENARDEAELWSIAAQNAATGINWTKARLASNTNFNISSPIGDIDSVALVAGDRVLLKNQTTTSQNGIYIWNGLGVPMTRAADMDTWAEVVSKVVLIEEGATNADLAYMATVNTGGTIGTTAITFTLFSPPLQDGAVSTAAKIVDGIITYAKMAASVFATFADVLAGTANKIIPATVGKEMLGKVLLATYTPSGVSSVDITSVISSNYDSYEIELTDLTVATDAVNLNLVTSANNGSSWDTGAGNYKYVVGYDSDAGAASGNGSTSATAIKLLDTVGNAANEDVSGTICLYGANTATHKKFMWDLNFLTSAGVSYLASGAGRRLAAAAINAVRIIPSSGNISSGIVRVYGVRK